MLFFTKNHLWISESEKGYRIGLSEYACNKFGSILFISLFDCGDEIYEGSKFGDVESIKTVTDLISPVTGRIVSVNEDILDDTDILMENPNSTWLIEVELENLPTDILSVEAYKDYLKNEL